ncbi:MAG TPA: DinB family protein, partial [Gemmataceae bacterium]|nr:DinB family protein [Gemmataceae bacterium]
MPINELLIREFKRDLDATKKTLQRVPKDKWDWKPHEKSGTLGWMAGHVASLPGFVIAVSTAQELDIAGPNARPPKVEKDTDLVELHGKLG